MTNKELQSHIKALGQWADGNKKRIAFAVCVEEKNDENFESWVLQYGSSLKLPYYLASVAKDSEEIRDTICEAGEAIKSPIGMMMLKAAMDDDPTCGTVEDKDKSDLAEKICQTEGNIREVMEPIVYGLSNERYHRGEEERQYLSSSLLKKYLISPKAYKYAIDNPTEEKSDALRFGSLFHDLMACCAEHYDNGTEAIGEWMRGIAVFTPPKNEKTGQPYGVTTKAYKETYEAFLQASEGKTVASQDEIDTATHMAMSLINQCGATSEQVRKLLKWTKATEVSYFYETEDGIKLKVRPDLLTRSKIVDWKTCALDSLDEDSIVKQILRYGYHISLSMYQFVLHEIEGKWYTPILIFVQKSEPHDCLMCDMSEWCYTYFPDEDFVKPGVGAMEFQRLLKLHTECVRNNEWPGAENTIEADGNTRIMKPAVPYWYAMKYFEI